jgi:hypothetical protein
MKASPKIIQKNENPLHLAQGCFAGAFIQPPRRGSGKSGRASQDAGTAVKKRKVIA